MKKYLRVGDVAEQLKVSASTVRHYTSTGELPYTTTPHGHRVFTQIDIDNYLGKEQEKEKIVFYTRSSNGDEKLLKNQEQVLLKEYGEPLQVYKDKGSGLNENRKQLQKLLNDAKNKQFNKVCITQKDRLTRFGYSYLEALLKEYNITVEVLYSKNEATLQEELLQDFMNLLASFSGKFYRLRGYEQKQQLLAKAGEELDKTH